MKKILALVAEAYGGGGGIAQTNRDLFEALHQKFEIFVLPRKSNPIQSVLPKNIQQEQAVMNRLWYAKKAFQVARREKIDFVFCGHLLMAPLARMISKTKNIPLWVHLYGIDAWEKPSGMVRGAVEHAELVTAISRFTRRKFLSWAGNSPEKVKILPVTYGEVFQPGSKSESLVERYGLTGKRVLLTVGRLAAQEKYKGHDRVIRALPEILKQVPDAMYVIAGEGDDKKRLETLAKDQGVSDQVLFIGYISEKELPALYRTADVFVMPSAKEGFGIVFLEAAASGIPVVGGQEGGSLDALAEGKIGRMIEADNISQLEEALLQGLRLPRVKNEAVERFSRARYAAHAFKMAENL